MGETADLIVERDLPIPMDDGIVLRADVFRPQDQARVPVIMTMGPYGKGLAYQDGYAPEWEWLIRRHPEVLEGSSGRYMVWETVDPERWVPFGYAVVRVDSRGAGRSPGILDCWSPREARDYYLAIEWAAGQPWCSGRVGLCGVSYYAMNQWHVAQLNPPHLAAIVPWDGANDHYREVSRHGGILSNGFFELWYPSRVLRMQHGKGHRGPWDRWLDEPAAGPETLSEEELAANRTDLLGNMLAHPLDDQFHRSRSADFSKITVPLLSAANWGGFGLHPRGNFTGFTESASRQKWLEVHGGRHEEWFYLPVGIDLQRRFLDHFLKGIDNGWDQEAPVLLFVRRPGERFQLRREQAWPLERTRWTKLHLNADALSLSWQPSPVASRVTFDALGEGVAFSSPPLREETEVTGPLAAKLFLSSSTSDADLFLTLQAFSPEGEEVTFQGTLDPATPLAQGWLRASHREIDPVRSKPYQPYHPHVRAQPLVPHRVYEVDVEIWPTCIILPPGYRLVLTVSGRDFARGAKGLDDLANRGCGPFLHTHPQDRPRSIFGGRTTLHTGPGHEAYLLLPIVPRGGS
ncbi:MAG TPA: CocE/NonD family hydrolase [Candidatus Dormibacteraeota bacterium]|nr:CocE/NonD family hydrolase [Candidatus Dormibacteraeota bacterium]